MLLRDGSSLHLEAWEGVYEDVLVDLQTADPDTFDPAAVELIDDNYFVRPAIGKRVYRSA